MRKEVSHARDSLRDGSRRLFRRGGPTAPGRGRRRRQRHDLCARIAVRPFAIVVLSLLAGVSCRNARQSAAMPSLPEGADVYREHCAACHGLRGFGNGPASLAVQVRPRDFRNEPFRYISTMNGVPRREDLRRTIRNGRRFGEMPSHPHLTDQEVDRLVDYVLGIHKLGWTDRLKEEATEGEELTPEEIDEIAGEKVTPADPVEVPAPPRGFSPDTNTGHRLYLANCASCHGPTGRGDGLERPEDEQGRPIKVRDLTVGAFRGGTGMAALFLRMRCGVPGTPMASQALLSDEEIWQLVYYSLHLAGRHAERD